MRITYLTKTISILICLLTLVTNVLAVTTQPTKPTLGNNQPYITPEPPLFDAKAYIIMDANSGQVIAEKNSDIRLAPASLTKIMTLYVVAQHLKDGRIHLNDPVTISEKAWRMTGSKMFIKVGSAVSVQQLIDGIVIASGNDASVAIAEHIGGTEETFVSLMNQTAAKLGMINTHFVDSHGDSHGRSNVEYCSTAHDLAILTQAWIRDFPEYYPWFKQQWIVYNGIKQPNRNRLLWKDPSVDGMKTGHTGEAGYCLVASALRNGMRLITVVMGSPHENIRTNGSIALLNYGFRFFETHKLFPGLTPLNKQRIWLGRHRTTPIGLTTNLYATVPLGQYSTLKSKATLKQQMRAPIKKGQVCGELIIFANNKQISTQPLVALEDNPRGGIFSIFDYIALLFR